MQLNMAEKYSSSHGRCIAHKLEEISEPRTIIVQATVQKEYQQSTSRPTYMMKQGDALVSQLAQSIKESIANQFKEFQLAQKGMITNISEEVKSVRKLLQDRLSFDNRIRNIEQKEDQVTPTQLKNTDTATTCQEMHRTTSNQNQSQKIHQISLQVPELTDQNSKKSLILHEIKLFQDQILKEKRQNNVQLQLKMDDLIIQLKEKDKKIEHLKDLVKRAKESKQQSIKKGKKTQNEYQAQIQLKDIKYRSEIQQLKVNHIKELEELDLKLKYKEQHRVELTHITSNSRFQSQKLYAYIERTVQQFEGSKIVKADLLFQSDCYYQNFSNYLYAKQGESFSTLLLFYSAKKVLFGAYIKNFSHRTRKDNPTKKVQVFLFNATNQQAFYSSKQTKFLNPVTYSDGYLYFGNRQIELKNNNLKSLKIYCGCMIGEQYYAVGHRQKLTCEERDEIMLDRVEIHRLHFENNFLTAETPTN